RDELRQREASNRAGWRGDVRGNGGGNMWPMVAGVGPVLGEGVVGFFVSPTGSSSPWTFQGASALSGTTELSRTTTPYALLAGFSPRVALLTDNLVASSGEAVVVAFRGRPNTPPFRPTTPRLSTPHPALP